MIVGIGSDLCNIGHFLIDEAIFIRLGDSVRHMRELMGQAR